MRSSQPNAILRATILAAAMLLLGATVSLAQQEVDLTAGATSITLPDGSLVPMWGYTCGSTQVSGSTATCASLNTHASGSWSPVVITVPSNATGGLQIVLRNNLPSPVPTSIVIVGQLGGGLGTKGSNCPTGGANCTPAIVHPTQNLTWPVGSADATNTPPTQGPRVQSFSTEVAQGATTSLPPWSNLRPGTYLIESGTHPSIQGPMGLYGILVVTAAPTAGGAGTAYPGIAYNAEIPMLFSEIDPVQNAAVAAAVATPGFSESATMPIELGATDNLHKCTGGAAACYPPAVNYTPLYYLINGVAFDLAHPDYSLFATAPAGDPANGQPLSGTVLVRLVNAALLCTCPRSWERKCRSRAPRRVLPRPSVSA